MSPLDSAYAAAMKNSDEQSTFYNAFFNAMLYIPTHELPEEDQQRRAGDDESISPIFSESEGIQYLMLFDSKERLSAWAQREVGFVALPGHAIVEMMNTDIHWALNAGTDHMKTFVPDEIQWLKETIAKSKGQEGQVPEGTNVLIGAPATIPDGLIESLSRALSRNGEVKRAYLGQVHYETEGEKPHLALVIETTELPQSTFDAICKDLASATKEFLGQSEYIDIMRKNESGVANEITKSVDAFYVSPN
jgi:SseB protein N-terminal domain/SseB protein C-terminal domain